ncbi:hypothetical protein C8R45DRAFT_1104902 [Mycena sanguinolenta]|nr:hypothetical protein C8R45DRAFT_1104902 [Mycena sanguinolenta]
MTNPSTRTDASTSRDSRGSWDPPSVRHEEHGIPAVTRLKPESDRGSTTLYDNPYRSKGQGVNAP